MRISGLVTAIKGFTHMDQAMVAEPVDLGLSLANTVTVLRAKARQKSATVAIELEAGLPRVRGFAGELNQIWGNLIDNALDAVEEGGHVEVKASREGERVVVRIVDDGPGIPAAIRERIFDPFFSTKPMGQGTGLGFDIVRRLVRHNDGVIEVDSKPGRTEFRVALPIDEAQKAGASAMNKPVLLIVDDDPQVLAAVRRDLRSRYRENYTVMSAASGEDALNAIRELKSRGDSLAMLISDQRMPGMMGSEVLAKSRPIYPLARRVLLTAYSDIDAAVKAINEAHLDHYLSKPWEPPEERLFPAIDDLLDAWQAEYLAGGKGSAAGGPSVVSPIARHQGFSGEQSDPLSLARCNPRRGMLRALLDAAGVGVDELPALFFDDGSPVLRNPDPRQVAERLGKPLTAAFEVYDLAIVGAGPAGLAAAVYGASEGLRTLLLDRHAPGGQAGSSSRIENYLGFPAGVSGSELTRRAITQAQRLGAEFLAPLEVTGLSIDGGYKRLALADGRQIVTRVLLASTGMFYREHPAPGIAEHTGAGVYYGAATTEAAAFRDRRVTVVGGGNSAGQGAIYLARYASEVEIVIRRDSLRETMSQYLIEQIEKTPNIRLRP